MNELTNTMFLFLFCPISSSQFLSSTCHQRDEAGVSTASFTSKSSFYYFHLNLHFKCENDLTRGLFFIYRIEGCKALNSLSHSLG